MAAPLTLTTSLSPVLSATEPKGSDVGSIAMPGDFTRFFNPRTDRWLDHFRLEGATIHPLTPIGEVTVRIFGFNDRARLHEREEMIRFGTYPSHG
jgi:hypothetical protein